MKRNLLLALSASVAAVLMTALPAFAAVTVYNNPGDDAYLGSTGKCDLGGPVFSTTTTCTDANGLSATFSSPVQILQVPSSWNNWSAFPLSESATPKVAFTGFGVSSITIDESNVLSPTAGVEMEPNLFATFTMTATFYDYQDNVIATVSRSVTTPFGARLFAITSDEAVIAKIVLSCSSSCGGFGFGFAQLHATDFTTNPSTTSPSLGGSSPSSGASTSTS